ncbi:MAG: hypothetical protein WC718_05990, partial [Phycisphaerales bacterium]
MAGACEENSPPFVGGIIGLVSYDFGRRIEPKALGVARRGGEDAGWPELVWFACRDALVFDHAERVWWGVGEIEFPGPARQPPDGWRAEGWRSGMGREAYIAAVTRALEYIRAGDVYQVNLAHRLAGRFEGSPRGLFGAMLAHAKPWYGAYL